MNEKKIKLGLTTAQVVERINKGLDNKLGENNNRSIVSIILVNILDLPNAIIFISILLLLIYRQYQDALLISVIITTNSLVSILQEFQARRSLEKINIVTKEPILVIRNETETEINPENIVVDEVIKLQSGHYLFVDGKLLETESLLVDESILTGESEYVNKKVGDNILSGSFVVAGKGYYIATKVGTASLVNQITKAAKKYINYLSPLQLQISQIVKLFTYLTILLIAVILSLYIFVLKVPRIEVLHSVISIVTAMVPQGIVLTLTIAFTLGVIRMYRQRILVQKASAIEALASINVICMDKTGTLTQNNLTVEHFENLLTNSKLNFEEILGILCHYSIERNKTILALEKAFPFKEKLTVKIVKQIPFTSKTKFSGMSIHYENQHLEVLLGSLEALSSKLPAEISSKLTELDNYYATKGQRNLFIIYKLQDQLSYLPLGFISLKDKLRIGAKKIVQQFTAQGIKLVIISGDHPSTILALTKRLDPVQFNKVISGKELAALKNIVSFDETVFENNVFARVSPEQKEAIIKSYQKFYPQVAMVGDGVNDALAIKQANLGISLGSGAAVTKNISDVVLIDDDLLKLSVVLNQGREILFNSLRSAQLLIVKNYYSLVIIVGSLLFNLAFPFSPRGLFLLALFNTNLPIAMILSESNLKIPLVKFTEELIRFVVINGTIAGSIGLMVLYLYKGQPKLAQTMLLSFLIISGVINYLIIINRSTSIREVFKPKFRTYISLVTVIVYSLIMYIKPFREFALIDTLNIYQWVLILILVIWYFIIMRILINSQLGTKLTLLITNKLSRN